MYIFVTKSKVIRGNLKIFMIRENRKGSLAGNFFNVFSGSYLFALAYLYYISLDTKPSILPELMKRNSLLFPLPESFLLKIPCNSSTSIQHKSFLQAASPIHYEVLFLSNLIVRSSHWSTGLNSTFLLLM